MVGACFRPMWWGFMCLPSPGCAGSKPALLTDSGPRVSGKRGIVAKALGAEAKDGQIEVNTLLRPVS
jgi:hypothetical protein